MASFSRLEAFLLRKIERGRGHAVATACLGPRELKVARGLISRKVVAKLPPNKFFPYERLVVTSLGSYEMGLFSQSRLEPRVRRAAPLVVVRTRSKFDMTERLSIPAALELAKGWPWHKKTMPYSEFRRRIRAHHTFRGASDRLVREAYRALLIKHATPRRRAKVAKPSLGQGANAKEVARLNDRALDVIEQIQGRTHRIRVTLRNARQMAQTGESGRVRAKRMIDESMPGPGGSPGGPQAVCTTFETYARIMPPQVSSNLRQGVKEELQKLKQVAKEASDYRWGVLSDVDMGSR